jgi:hypothetical protein
LSITPVDEGVTITGIGNNAGDETVDEADLPEGSSPDTAALTQTGTFDISANDGYGNLTIGGALVVTNGVVTLPASPVTTAYGKLTITDINLDTGVVSYSYELTGNTLAHGPADNGQNYVLDNIAVTLTDTDGDADTSTLVVKVVDDVPTVTPIMNGAQASGAVNTNLMLILDVSGSMGDSANFGGMSRLEAEKQATLELLDQYEALGNVKVNIVIFSSYASNPSSGWVDVDTAKAIVQGLTANGNTNYDDALNTAWNAFGAAGKIDGAQNVSYFLSDGAPNNNGISAGTVVHSPLGGGSGIDADEETAWENFLHTNNIKSYALGMGSGVTQSNLEPVAYDGTGSGQEMSAIVVTDFSQLASTLTATVFASPVSGDLLDASGGLSAKSGADGGSLQSVASISAGGTIYSYDLATDASSINGPGSGTFNTITNEWTINTTGGGTLKIDMDNGEYVYTPPSSIGSGISEVFGYTIVDGDGDTATSTLTITIDPAQGPMVVRDDYVITNQDPVIIPDWALLANDAGPNSATQALTGVSSANGGWVADNANSTVTFDDDDTLDGSFKYTNTAGGNSEDGTVKIDHVTGNTLTGTYLGEILIGGSASETLNGKEGNDILIAGGGNDTLYGGAGNDTMWGGTGAGSDSSTDTFRWSWGDQGTAGTPAVDIIKDFDTSPAASGGDVLNLKDLLPNFQYGQDGTAQLANVLHFSLNDGNTTIQVKSSAGLAGPDQIIVLEGIDLVTGHSDQQIIQSLLNNGNLITN